MWEALEQMGWVKTLSSTGWMYASVSVIHYLTMFWFIGSMAVVDLRVMGVAARKRNLTELSDQIFPWAWTGMVLAIVSGFFMFLTDAGDWAPDPVFHVKLGMIILSIVFAILVQRGAPKWSALPEIPTSAKVIAADCVVAVDSNDSERVGNSRDGRSGIGTARFGTGNRFSRTVQLRKKRGRPTCTDYFRRSRNGSRELRGG